MIEVYDIYTYFIYNNFMKYPLIILLYCKLDTGARQMQELHNARKRKYGYRIPTRTKLDSLLSGDKPDSTTEDEGCTLNSEDYVSSSEDVEDVVFQKVVQPTRTGNFDVDFPPLPKVSKGTGTKGKRSKNPINISTTQNSPSTSMSTSIVSEDNNSVARESNIEEKNGVDVGVNTTKSIEDSTVEEREDDNRITEITSDVNEVGETSNDNQLSEELDPMGNIRPSGIISKKKKVKKICLHYDKFIMS